MKIRTAFTTLIAAASLVLAQDAPTAPRSNDGQAIPLTQELDTANPPPFESQDSNLDLRAPGRDREIAQAGDPDGWRRLGQRGQFRQRGDQPGPPPPARYGAPPPQITVPSGTFINIRVNQVLSSDRSRPGEVFSASLVKPIVVDGIVVADRGQTIAGRVAEARKAGRIKGTSVLGIELTEITLVDGAQVPLRTQLIAHEGPGSVGRDATAIGTTSALGAIIGAAAEGGQAAGIGAGAGAGAALIGVLLTRGRPTIIYPESVLSFRVDVPLVVNTTRAPQAFRNVTPGDYSQPGDQPRTVVHQAPPPVWGPGWGYGGWGPGWGYGGWGPGWGYPGFYGPRVGVFVGGRFGGRRGFGRRW